jgi:hypothetical protein
VHLPRVATAHRMVAGQSLARRSYKVAASEQQQASSNSLTIDTIPSITSYVTWHQLSDPACNLLGPLNFQPRLLASDRHSIVAAPHWEALFSICQSRGIIPWALSPTTQSRWLARTPRKRTRFA